MKEVYEQQYSKICLELEQILKKAEQKILNTEDIKLSKERLSQSIEIVRETTIEEGLKDD